LGDRPGPVEGAGLLVPVSAPAHDDLFEPPGAIEVAGADGLGGDQCEPAFDQVEPRGTGGSEVQVETRMGRQPAFDPRMFEGPIVVADSDATPASGSVWPAIPGRR